MLKLIFGFPNDVIFKPDFTFIDELDNGAIITDFAKKAILEVDKSEVINEGTIYSKVLE